CAVLFCPAVDLTYSVGDPPSDALIQLSRRFGAEYLAGHPVDDPLVNPLGADLSGLPPLLIQAATGDNQLECARELAVRATEQGVEVRFELYPTETHDFQIFWSFLPDAGDAVERAGEFIRSPG